MRFSRLLAGLSALSLLCGGCAGAEAGGPVTIHYALWDANQLPAYEACADAFHARNPGITVKIDQTGWDDYWTDLTLGMVAESAPDVFTDHLQKYGQFVDNNQIEPLDDYIARDKVDTSGYFPGLAELWRGSDGKRYGLPKDWDTVALFYNKMMATEAGLTDADLTQLTWNPTDGGTFEKVLARLSVDVHGKRGNEPGFDPAHVRVYGFGYDSTGYSASGQTQWSFLVKTLAGFDFTDRNPWGTHYNFDDPRFIRTITWYRDLIAKGFAPPLSVAVSGGSSAGVSASDQMGAGKYALVPHGDWMISTFAGLPGVDVGLAPLPVGPSGKRASMFNGLSDAIYAGGKHKEQAWQWVKFLASADCQNIVGSQAVVFPALPSGTDVAKKTYAGKGIDVSAFTVNVDDKTTFPFPVTAHAADINAMLQPLFDSIFSFRSDPAVVLPQTNARINTLFK